MSGNSFVIDSKALLLILQLTNDSLSEHVNTPVFRSAFTTKTLHEALLKDDEKSTKCKFHDNGLVLPSNCLHSKRHVGVSINIFLIWLGYRRLVFCIHKYRLFTSDVFSKFGSGTLAKKKLDGKSIFLVQSKCP